MTKIIEIRNCQECPFCNNDNEYGFDECNLSNKMCLSNQVSINSWEELPKRHIHPHCPLIIDEVIVGIKMESKPTLADHEKQEYNMIHKTQSRYVIVSRFDSCYGYKNKKHEAI